MEEVNDALFQRLPDLPKDIGRLILEHLASIGDTSSALISKEVQRWVEPIIYQDVWMTTPRQVELFHRTLVTSTSETASNKPPDLFQTSVKALCFNSGRLPFEVVARVINSCSSAKSIAVVSLSLHSELARSTDHANLHPMTGSPTHLFVMLIYLKTVLFPFPFFKNVTHLELQSHSFSDVLAWPRLYLGDDGPAMPNLTHLALGLYPNSTESPKSPAQVAKEIISNCPPRLKVFLMVVSADAQNNWSNFWDGIREISRGDIDPRALAVFHPIIGASPQMLDESEERMIIRPNGTRFSERWAQWGRLETVDKGYWGQAESLLRERRREKAAAKALGE